MVSQKSVTKQLRQVGCDYALWGRTEIHELANILMDNERIMQAINGYYDGGFALLCTTNYRVLVVDKKPFLLTVEDLRYDMIAEVDYSSRIFSAVLHIYTPLRTLMFTSWSMTKLRKTTNYIQQRVMELRNNDYLASQFATTAAQKMPVAPAIRPQPQRKKLFPMYKAGGNAAAAGSMPSNPIQPAGMTNYSVTPRELVDQLETDAGLGAVPTTPRPIQATRQLINPYTKVPLLARRRKYPSFY